jgi:hypothetical protein
VVPYREIDGVRALDREGTVGVCAVAVEIAIDAAVVGLLPLDVSAQVEFEEQGVFISAALPSISS